MTSKRPILVTGSHRSGSTWVGRVMSASPAIGYIDEPFNINHGPGICGAKFVYWFTYVTDENESLYYKHIKNTIGFHYNLRSVLRTIRSWNDVKRVSKEYLSFTLYRFRKATPLVKDPIAVFSAEWLARRFDMDVLVLIRHPAAFASSLKRLNWIHPFSHFLEQPLLMRDYLYPFGAQIEEYARSKHDVVDQAILLWKIIYHTIIRYQNQHRDWIFMRHEDISRDPRDHFQDLFERFGLDFSSQVREVVHEYSDPTNPSEAPEGSHSLRRDSKSNIWNWKNRLDKSEIERIREQVEDLSRVFYSDDDW